MDGVDDGARTHDNWNHNPGLYQLSYAHHNNDNYRNMVRPAGLEPATLGLEGRCSIQMSYGRMTCSKKLVGAERFELPTSCSQSRRATRLRYAPIVLACIIHFVVCDASFICDSFPLAVRLNEEPNSTEKSFYWQPFLTKKHDFYIQKRVSNINFLERETG